MRPPVGAQARLAIRLAEVKLRILLAAAAVALAAAPTARAATWRQLTAAGGSNIDQVGLLRTGDGVVHVIWHRQTGANTEDLLHTTIGADGRIGATSTVAAGWATLANAALTAVPGGIRADWGGIRTTDPDETNQEMNTALSIDGGTTWVLQPGSVVPLGAQSYGSPVSATTRPDGTPVIAWAGTLGTWTHAGLTPATPNFDHQAPLGHYGYDPGIASDAAGKTMMAWYSNATGYLGPFAQGVNPDGSPLGSPLNMPGTADMSVGMLSRTPIVARAGGGFYVAYATGYPTQDAVRVWAVGASRTTLIKKTASTTTVALAGDPSGRLWVVWKDGADVLASRSNKKATAWGAAVQAGAPKSASSLYALDASATAAGADLFGLFSLGSDSHASTYHTRIRPGLTLEANRRSLPAKAITVGFTVTDAGAPVKGAKVKASGRSATTDGRGRASLSLKGKATVTASATGYEPASLRLK
jgi:hypothetical protein